MNKNYKKEKDLLRDVFSQIRKKHLFKVQTLILNQVEISLNTTLNANIKEGFIGLYWPLEGEIDLRSLNKSTNNKTALPAVIKGRKMNYHPWLTNSLGEDLLKIPAPIKERVLSPEEISILLVPALAIDKNGYRLGYGGGYFDRLRKSKRWRAIPSYIILPEACVSKEPLPFEDWDIPFNGWISEDGLHKIKSIAL